MEIKIIIKNNIIKIMEKIMEILKTQIKVCKKN